VPAACWCVRNSITAPSTSAYVAHGRYSSLNYKQGERWLDVLTKVAFILVNIILMLNILTFHIYMCIYKYIHVHTHTHTHTHIYIYIYIYIYT
jgi:hypothetical protein